MTAADIEHELDRDPVIALRLHLSSGQKIDILYPNTAWVEYM